MEAARIRVRHFFASGDAERHTDPDPPGVKRSTAKPIQLASTVACVETSSNVGYQ
jgi:hypothetical protein